MTDEKQLTLCDTSPPCTNLATQADIRTPHLYESIRVEVLARTDLSAGLKVLWVNIAKRLWGAATYAWPSVATLAVEGGTSRSSIYRQIQEGIAKKVLVRRWKMVNGRHVHAFGLIKFWEDSTAYPQAPEGEKTAPQNRTTPAPNRGAKRAHLRTEPEGPNEPTDRTNGPGPLDDLADDLEHLLHLPQRPRTDLQISRDRADLLGIASAAFRHADPAVKIHTITTEAHRIGKDPTVNNPIAVFRKSVAL